MTFSRDVNGDVLAITATNNVVFVLSSGNAA